MCKKIPIPLKKFLGKVYIYIMKSTLLKTHELINHFFSCECIILNYMFYDFWTIYKMVIQFILYTPLYTVVLQFMCKPYICIEYTENLFLINRNFFIGNEIQKIKK